MKIWLGAFCLAWMIGCGKGCPPQYPVSQEIKELYAVLLELPEETAFSVDVDCAANRYGTIASGPECKTRVYVEDLGSITVKDQCELRRIVGARQQCLDGAERRGKK